MPPSISPQPVLLPVEGWADYTCVDTGLVNGPTGLQGRKLERIGPYLIDRPEPSALWPAAKPKQWAKAIARFGAKTEDDEAAGQWALQDEWPEAWPMQYGGVRFLARRTSFRHVGFFPEQEAQWRFLQTACQAPKQAEPLRVLNLFGYSGVMSLVAAQAGATVTHVDASKKSVGWARENAALNGFDAIRWIVDDAAKFAAREVRRGAQYDGIILDPPKYGRGPDGETWDFFADLPSLLADCARLLSDRARFLIVTGYSARLSARSLAELTTAALPGHSGRIDYGDYTLQDATGRQLGLALFARWSAV